MLACGHFLPTPRRFGLDSDVLVVLTVLGGGVSAFGAWGPRFQRQLPNGILRASQSCLGVLKLLRGDHISHSRWVSRAGLR